MDDNFIYLLIHSFIHSFIRLVPWLGIVMDDNFKRCVLQDARGKFRREAKKISAFCVIGMCRRTILAQQGRRQKECPASDQQDRQLRTESEGRTERCEHAEGLVHVVSEQAAGYCGPGESVTCCHNQ